MSDVPPSFSFSLFSGPPAWECGECKILLKLGQVEYWHDGVFHFNTNLRKRCGPVRKLENSSILHSEEANNDHS
jgi:hypothetical protein